MKKIFAALVISVLCAPAFASADAYGIQPTLGQLLSRVAALEAILSHASINCAVAATKSTVKVGEAFTIGWGSYGADTKYATDPLNRFAENGEQLMRIDAPGVRSYSFSFFGQNGQKKTCDLAIAVLP